MENNEPSRPVATTDDNEFTLTIEGALALYTAANIPRSPRSIQRYCKKNILISRRIDEGIDETYLITRASVEKHIAYIISVTPPTSRDLSRPVATTVAQENKDDIPRQHPATIDDPSRPVATATSETPPENIVRQSTTTPDQSRLVATTVAQENKDDMSRQEPTTTSDKSRHVATDFSIFEHPYVKRLETEVEEFKEKYDKQIRRTEEVLEAANKRLVDMAQTGQIAGSKTLAEFLLASKNPPPSPAEYSDVRDPDKP